MPTPQYFMSGTNSGLPLQPSVRDLAFEFADPLALCLEHRDLVLQLDQRQPCHARAAELTHDSGQLFRDRGQGDDALTQKLSCPRCSELVHEHESGGEV